MRLEFRKNKITYHKKLISDIGQSEGEANLWKAIDKMCYRKSRTNQTYAVRKEDGGWCETEREELAEIKAYCCPTYKKTRRLTNLLKRTGMNKKNLIGRKS